jgi:AraC-like DNA-binding protein
LSNAAHPFDGLGRCLPAVRTTEVEVARSHLARHFTRHDLVLKGRDIAFLHQQATLCDVSLSLLRYGSEVQVIAPALPDFYLFQWTLTGHVCIRSSRFELALGPGTLFVMNPGVPYRKHWSHDARQLMLKIPRSRLQARFGEEFGEETPRPVLFESRPCTPDHGRALTHLLEYLCRDLADSNGLGAAGFVRRDMEDLLLSGILATLPHDQSGAYERDIASPAPHYVQRAEAYMRSTSSPVSLRELVRETGVSERSLLAGFRRFRGTTPAQFSRDLRLDRARRALTAADAGTWSVTDVALEFGFGHLGRFAGCYLARFGELPSETVRRSRH